MTSRGAPWYSDPIADDLDAWSAPGGPLEGLLVGRVDLPADRCVAGIGGPTPVAIRRDGLWDLMPFGPTVADLLEREDVADLLGRSDLRHVGTLEELATGSAAQPRDGTAPALLAPFDLQVVRAAGVTFAESLVERVIEEGARGDAGRAEAIRARLGKSIGADLGDIEPGSEAARQLKAQFIEEGLWSQYLEVGIGPDAEIFTKAPVLASVGHEQHIGVRDDSAWNNPEPEVVLAVTSSGRIVAATLGNDVNLRDFEGRSALLLPEAKDNNASCAIGPFLRVFDDRFSLDALMASDVGLEVRGQDGFATSGSNRLSRISRHPGALVEQALGRTHQYPDGLALFLGTMYIPTVDRDAPGAGFSHHVDDRVRIDNPYLGVLRNTVGRTHEVPPWTMGIRAFWANLVQRTSGPSSAADGPGGHADARATA